MLVRPFHYVYYTYRADTASTEQTTQAGPTAVLLYEYIHEQQFKDVIRASLIVQQQQQWIQQGTRTQQQCSTLLAVDYQALVRRGETTDSDWYHRKATDPTMLRLPNTTAVTIRENDCGVKYKSEASHQPSFHRKAAPLNMGDLHHTNWLLELRVQTVGRQSVLVACCWNLVQGRTFISVAYRRIDPAEGVERRTHPFLALFYEYPLGFGM